MPDKKKSNVVISNRTPQTLSVSLDVGNGPTTLRLAGFAHSDPVDESHVTDYTKQLAQHGHIQIRAVN